MTKLKPPFVRSPYNYDTNEAGDESGIDTGNDGGAKQSFKEECDINTIVRRFGLGHEMPTNFKMPEYGDYTNIPDFQTAMNLTAEARTNFELLPAAVRAKFENDTTKFVEWALDPKNKGELKELGLLSPEAIKRDEAIELEQKIQDAAAAAAAPQPAPGQPASSPATPATKIKT